MRDRVALHQAILDILYLLNLTVIGQTRLQYLDVGILRDGSLIMTWKIGDLPMVIR